MGVNHVVYRDGKKYLIPITDQEQYLAIRNSAKNLNVLQQVRAGNTELKKKLVQFNYSCFAADKAGVPLKNCKAILNTVGMDIDLDKNDPEYEEKMAALPSLLLSKREKVGIVELSGSATKGYHLVAKRRPELTQEENLRWLSEVLGVAFDEGAKDTTRVFFTTSASDEDLIFLDPALFEYEECKEPAAKPSKPSCHDSAKPAPMVAVPQVGSPAGDMSYQGFAYSDIPKAYIKLFLNGKEPKQGDRNAITFEMARTFGCIVGFDQAELEKMIPRYDGFPEDEWRQTISNALKEPHKGMPYRMNAVLKYLREQNKADDQNNSTPPPPMPRNLPALLKHLSSNVPAEYKAAVCMTAFAPLGAHFHGVKFKYIDNVLHEPTFMTTLIAPMSTGKSCISKPISYIMEDIEKRDALNRKREADWKESNKIRGDNKKKEPRPTDLLIQCLQSDATSAALMQRLIDANNAGGYFIFSKFDEIEMLQQIRSNGKGDTLGLLIRNAYDQSTAGAERVGIDSVSGTAPVRFNFVTSTTPERGRKFMQGWTTDGTMTRMDFCTIYRPDSDDDDNGIPVYGIYDDAYAAKLKPFIDRINSCSGLIECPEASNLARRLIKECYVAAKYTYESDAYRILSYRACVSAFLRAMVLFVAHGYEWSREIESFIRWSVAYDLWVKMKYFGEDLERDIAAENKYKCRGPQNVLDLLEEDFTLEEYRAARQRLGRKGNGLDSLRQLIHRKRLAFDDLTQIYHKLKR